MKEATPMAGELIPPTLNKRAVNNNKGPKQTTSQEVRIAASSLPFPDEKSIQSFTRKRSFLFK